MNPDPELQAWADEYDHLMQYNDCAICGYRLHTSKLVFIEEDDIEVCHQCLAHNRKEVACNH